MKIVDFGEEYCFNRETKKQTNTFVVHISISWQYYVHLIQTFMERASQLQNIFIIQFMYK